MSNENSHGWKTLSILSLFVLAAHSKATQPKQRVCVIGAGPGGLISAKNLADHPDEFEIVVFEKQSDVGGQWIYTNSTTVDEHGLPVHSGVYWNLRLNAPKEYLTYPNFTKIIGENTSWVRHTTVLEYLRNYTDHFNLRQYIKFDTNVETVTPLPRMRWLVGAKDLNTEGRSETECDAIIVSNGQTIKGYIPEITGIEHFSGRVLHSHDYRVPEVFAKEKVAILGAGFSALDISGEVSEFADTVYLSHRHDKLEVRLPPNLVQTKGVVAAKGDDLILSDGLRIQADTLILCTGYVYDFPFLNASSGIEVDSGKYVRYVYKDLINVKRPTMAILNIPQPSVNLLLPHAQVLYYVAVLRGKVKLPSREEMLKEAELPSGTPKNKAHYLLEKLFVYYDELAVPGGGKPIPEIYNTAGALITEAVSTDPLHFREKNLYIYENGTVEYK